MIRNFRPSHSWPTNDSSATKFLPGINMSLENRIHHLNYKNKPYRSHTSIYASIYTRFLYIAFSRKHSQTDRIETKFRTGQFAVYRLLDWNYFHTETLTTIFFPTIYGVRVAAIQANNVHDQGTQRVLRALLHERIQLYFNLIELISRAC